MDEKAKGWSRVGWRHTIALIAVSFRRENRARSIRAGLDVDYVTHPCPTSTPKPLPPRPPSPRVTQRRKVTSHRDNRAPRGRVGRHGNAISPFSCVCIVFTITSSTRCHFSIFRPSFSIHQQSRSRYRVNQLLLANFQLPTVAPDLLYTFRRYALPPRPDFVSIVAEYADKEISSPISRVDRINLAGNDSFWVACKSSSIESIKIRRCVIMVTIIGKEGNEGNGGKSLADDRTGL